MASQVIDAVERLLVRLLVEVGAAAQAAGQQPGHPGITAPEAAHLVAIAAVPFRPALPRETADLINPGGVPRLGDQLHAA